MTNKQIKKIFLENGFKEKQQPDGSFDLNPYVYDAARALLIDKLKQTSKKVFSLIDDAKTVDEILAIEEADNVLRLEIEELKGLNND